MPISTIIPRHTCTRPRAGPTPATVWATLGVAALVLQGVIYTRWIISDGIHAAPRDYSISTSRMAITWVEQAIVLFLLVVTALWVRWQCRKEGELTFYAARPRQPASQTAHPHRGRHPDAGADRTPVRCRRRRHPGRSSAPRARGSAPHPPLGQQPGAPQPLTSRKKLAVGLWTPATISQASHAPPDRGRSGSERHHSVRHHSASRDRPALAALSDARAGPLGTRPARPAGRGRPPQPPRRGSRARSLGPVRLAPSEVPRRPSPGAVPVAGEPAARQCWAHYQPTGDDADRRPPLPRPASITSCGSTSRRTTPSATRSRTAGSCVQGSFTIALQTARNLVVQAAGVIKPGAPAPAVWSARCLSAGLSAACEVERHEDDPQAQAAESPGGGLTHFD
ncbi:hypothetical protein FHR34_007646 [Kitasatospora kifunensis]|uniref:Uncharacterized protein n=1 Tax=Kitasatospora kifunensis TaxID=58351 RepID=A0A7W7RAW4_KITKI|nr:hypothetical protein [Kitasatospora kifunensis]